MIRYFFTRTSVASSTPFSCACLKEFFYIYFCLFVGFDGFSFNLISSWISPGCTSVLTPVRWPTARLYEAWGWPWKGIFNEHTKAHAEKQCLNTETWSAAFLNHFIASSWGGKLKKFHLMKMSSLIYSIQHQQQEYWNVHRKKFIITRADRCKSRNNILFSSSITNRYCNISSRMTTKKRHEFIENSAWNKDNKPTLSSSTPAPWRSLSATMCWACAWPRCA